MKIKKHKEKLFIRKGIWPFHEYWNRVISCWMPFSHECSFHFEYDDEKDCKNDFDFIKGMD